MARARRRLDTGEALAAALLLPVRGPRTRTTPAGRPTAPPDPGARWRRLPVEPRGSSQIGVCFRGERAESLGLEPRAALLRLLRYPFDLVQLTACWHRMEPEPLSFTGADLDWQLDAAARAGKRVVLSVGGVTSGGGTAGGAPAHVLTRALPQGRLLRAERRRRLLDASMAFSARVVRQYRAHPAVAAWQVEWAPPDPLGLEARWRSAADFARQEAEAVRRADPDRPVLLAGPARQTRRPWRRPGPPAADQRATALVGIGPGHPSPAAPWSGAWRPAERPAERLLRAYNQTLRRHAPATPRGYLFRDAESWVLRARAGDPECLEAFAWVLANP
ncbi:hypothetical protein [Kitasatospora viridis]|uniref:Glycoside hydrolase family 42 N-terminal domain-containing protein n=1 Tax=Kitasatospora viridis TaxID=281105 RepID=A0A561UCD9_9ACTN|nr:hypothetical protein [Kitasatospora viridis]TWF97032.1 hypothetical protein FHX73_11807 [Kitasatospora viridis]